MKILMYFSILISLLLSGCQTKPEKPDTGLLDEAALQSTFAGGTFSWIHKGEPGTTLYMQGGEAVSDWRGKKTRGKWWLEDDTVCRTWEGYNAGKKKCFTVYDLFNGQYLHFRGDSYSHTEQRVTTKS